MDESERLLSDISARKPLTEIERQLCAFEHARSQLVDAHSLSRRLNLTDIQLYLSRHLLEKFPVDLGVAHLRSSDLLELGMLREANDLTRQIYEQNIKNLRSILNRGAFFLRSGDYTKALEFADLAVSAHPNDFRSYHSRYLVRLERFEYTNAALDLEIASRLKKPGSFEREYEDLLKWIRLRSSIERSSVESPPVLVFLASGGITHMLSCLGNVLHFAILFDGRCVPFTTVNPHFQLPFNDIFAVHPTSLLITEALNKDVTRSVIQRYGSGRFIRPKKHSDGRVYYILGQEDSYDALLFPTSGVLKEVLYLSGFEHFYKLPVQKALELSLSNVRLASAASDYVRMRALRLPEHYLSVHFRNTDYKTSLDSIFSEVDRYCGTYKYIYWATDDPDSLGKVVERYPNNIVIYNDQAVRVPLRNHPNLHCMSADYLESHGTSKWDQICDFFCDLYALARSDLHISSPNTSITHFVDLLRSRRALTACFFGWD